MSNTQVPNPHSDRTTRETSTPLKSIRRRITNRAKQLRSAIGLRRSSKYAGSTAIITITCGAIYTIVQTEFKDSEWLLLASTLLAAIGFVCAIVFQRNAFNEAQENLNKLTSKSVETILEVSQRGLTTQNDSGQVVEKLATISKELQQLYAGVSWTPHRREHDENVFGKMLQLLGTPSIAGLDVFSILKYPGEPSVSPESYYNRLEEQASHDAHFRYRRVIVNRLEPLSHYLSKRTALWNHIQRSATFKNVLISFYQSSERRLFDVSFGIFYVFEERRLVPLSLVIEITQTGLSGEVLGLLEIKRAALQSDLVKSFQEAFEAILRSSSVPCGRFA